MDRRMALLALFLPAQTLVGNKKVFTVIYEGYATIRYVDVDAINFEWEGRKVTLKLIEIFDILEGKVK